jgi:uncharacterized protein (DUF427 family)
MGLCEFRSAVDGVTEDVVWSCPDPLPKVAEISGLLG